VSGPSGRARGGQAGRAVPAVRVGRFADLDEQHRQWWALWAELWLYAQRHGEGAERLARGQAETRAVLAAALSRQTAGSTDQLAAVIHALWTGFMLKRLVNPDALAPEAFACAVRTLVGRTPITTPHDTGGTADG